MVEDAELLRRYAEDRSEAAFAELVRRHLDLVYSAALRRLGGDVHAAEDVAQQVFTALARQAASLKRGVVLPGWLYATTRNVAVDFIRAERRRRAREQEAHTMDELNSTPLSDTVWGQLRPVLDQVMDELSAADREVVVLRFFARRQFADIGMALSVSEDAARMRVDRALEKLRLLLDRRGVTSTAVALTAALANQAMVAAPIGLATTVTGLALAGSGLSGVGSATGYFTIMSTSKITAGVAGVVAFIAMGSAVYEFMEMRGVHAALAMVSRERDSLRTRLAQEETRMQDATSRTQAAGRLVTAEQSVEPSASATAEKSAARVAPAGGSSGGGAATSASALEILAGSPEYQQLALKQLRASLPLTYGPLYRMLNLSPQQIAEFEELLTGQSQAYMDMIAAAHAQGMSASDPSLGALHKPVDASFGEKLRALLGDDGAKQFAAYFKTVDARATVDSLAGNLYYTETPLSLAQADQLARIVAANMSNLKVNGLIPARKEIDWSAVIAQAQAVLAPPQLTTLQTLQEKARLQQQLSELSSALLRGEASPSAAAGKTPGG